MTDAGPPLALTGSSLIGFRESREASGGFRAPNPSTGETLEPGFVDATPSEVREREAVARDLAAHGELLRILTRKAGRIVLNGVPTGVEVTHAMQQGGPWPATTDARGIWRLVNGRPTRESL